MATRLPLVLVVACALSATAAGQQADLRALASEAYTFAYPALEAYRTFSEAVLTPEARGRGQAFNTFIRMPLADADSRWVVRPNNDTLYSSAWLDLRSGPVVVDLPAVPPGRYRSIQVSDLLTHNIGIAGGGDARALRYLVAGPSWRGPAPADVDGVLRSESAIVHVLARTAVYGKEDETAATAIQDRFTIRPTARPRRDLSSLPPFERSASTSADFLRYLNIVLTLMPAHPADREAIGRFAPLGVKPGVSARPETWPPQVEAEIVAGVREARATIDGARGVLGTPRGAWMLTDAFGDRGRMQGRTLVRAAAARFGIFGLDREEAVYYGVNVDAERRPLDATRRYQLTFGVDELPPAGAFWSVTMYGADGFLVANPLGRFSIGDRTAGLKRGPDGSITIYFQHDPPGPDRASNWLPTPSSGPFSAVLRVYRPDPRTIDAYRPPPVHAAP